MDYITYSKYEHRRAVWWVLHPVPLCSHLRLGALLRNAVSLFTASARRLAAAPAAHRCAARVAASQRLKKKKLSWPGPGIEPRTS